MPDSRPNGNTMSQICRYFDVSPEEERHFQSSFAALPVRRSGDVLWDAQLLAAALSWHCSPLSAEKTGPQLPAMQASSRREALSSYQLLSGKSLPLQTAHRTESQRLHPPLQGQGVCSSDALHKADNM